MTSYTPINDMLFILRDILKIEQYQDIPRLQDATDDLLGPILTEAGKVASELLHPLNQVGDEQGCRLEDGKVVTPDGFMKLIKLLSKGAGHLLHVTQLMKGKACQFF